MVKKEKGQVILALILIMTVALAIGLSVVQKSLVDISTATKVEESSRAFSAAEAGIEHALRGGNITQLPTLGDNNAKIKDLNDSSAIPCIPESNYCAQILGDRQAPREYPRLAKEEVAHVWLADFNSTNNPPNPGFTNTSLDVYWGDPNYPSDKAALEVSIVYYDGTIYKSQKWYLDNPNVTRTSSYNFDTSGDCRSEGTKPTFGTVTYQCMKTISSLPPGLMLLRARLLYNTNYQPFAVQAPTSAPPCSLGNGCFIPPQSRAYVSTGVSGETQRRVQVTLDPKVVPLYFDYAIFSAGDISK